MVCLFDGCGEAGSSPGDGMQSDSGTHTQRYGTLTSFLPMTAYGQGRDNDNGS